MYTAITSWLRRARSGDTPSNRRIVRRIRERAQQLESVADRELANRTADLRGRSTQSKPRSLPSSERLIDVFALATEAIRRTSGKVYYDVQLLAGIALAHGAIAQLQTGEGKTVTTVLPAVYTSLTGEGVHVATTNAYLAERDYHELQPTLELLGLSVGRLPHRHQADASRAAYGCDITFGPGYDFGFDFLRDQLQLRREDEPKLGERFLARLAGASRSSPLPLQRPLAHAIVDEADSVLVDEATMPLILSGAPGEPPPRRVYELALATADQLVLDRDLSLDIRQRRVEFSESGWALAHQALSRVAALPLRRPWIVYVENAVRAKYLLRRDVDYVVREGAVQIVDQHTGRIHEERNWRDGLHQAVELLEQLELTPETASDARITRQRYFQRYRSLAGMTGTAIGVEQELKQFYRLDTVIIPTHRPCRRRALRPLGFPTAEQRDEALAREAVECHQRRQPILIGTRTIRHSQELSARLKSLGIDHVLLNGVQDEEEAAIVARAGQSGAVTIATNMAGRGTDIRLDTLALSVGGLHVAAAEPNLSRRVDRQLAGRAARQGEPGSYRLFVAADDELPSQSESLGFALRKAPRNGECSFDLDQAIERAQVTIEAQQFALRCSMVSRDEWVDGILKSLVGKGD